MNIHYRHSSPQCTEGKERQRNRNRSVNTSVDINNSDEVQIIVIDNLKYDYQKVITN
jgi:hypothetical protein